MSILIHILLAIIWIIISTSRWKLHPLIALVVASVWVGLAAGIEFLDTLEEFSRGFGGLIGQIGLIIILGSIFGILLERSRAAVGLAQALWRGIGRKFPAFSTGMMGAVVGIPVFCDSGFILLNPIGKNLSKTSGISPWTFSLSLAGGLYLSHILIPPTPGPLAVSGIFGMESHLGKVLLLGILLSFPVLIITALWANRFSKKYPENHQETLSETTEQESIEIPSTFWSAMVLALPLVLITLGNLSPFFSNPLMVQGLKIAGNPLVAISSGLALGFFKLPEPVSGRSLLSEAFIDGIKVAGPILVLTGAGAGFGAVLKQTGLEQLLAGFDLGTGSLFIWLLMAFGIAAFLKTAQGSSTSAMVIAASLFVGIIPSEFLENPWQLTLCMSAIGAGAMTVSHANDSYFWIVKEFTGLTVGEALKSYTLLTAWMGITTLGLLLMISFFL